MGFATIKLIAKSFWSCNHSSLAHLAVDEMLIWGL